ncbi:MAG: formate dehydrogenase-N subunit alpha [Bryobacterales bacterium]|nr:formate dehydrogenase-N subunit alpha [Bryobacterales bacterium]
MTNGWTDIANADVILAMGGNPAENHPVGFRFVMDAKRNRNAKLISVDPRYNRTSAVSDSFTQIRVGTDIAFLGGLIHYALTQNRYHAEYVRLFTNATFLVTESYAFDEAAGLFSGWDTAKKAYADKSSWSYELDAQGFAKIDATMEHPRSVFQLMKKHYARYTPEMVSRICGCKPEEFVRAAELITSTFKPDKAGTILYALGWTHHSSSVQLIHTAAMLQLLLGNMGIAGGGLNALRGHANIQGGTDCGMGYHNLPGYVAIQKAGHQSLKTFIDAVTPKPLRPNAMNFYSNTDRFVVSQLKAFYGKAATRENDFAYHLHPKLPESAPGVDENWSWAYIFDHMFQGRMEGLISYGMNPVSNGPNSRKVLSGLSKLKWLVVAENFEQETAAFWKPNILELVGKKPADVQTEVFLLPAANFAEKDGTFTNSARWIQWKWKAIDPPGEALADQEITARIFLRVRELYAAEGGRQAASVTNLNWWYSNPSKPSMDEVLKEINGWAIQDIKDEKDPKTVVLKAGAQLGKFLDTRADGSTLCGNWLYIGCYPEAGNLTQRRNTADPSGLGAHPNWSFNWPANRRIMYNRCSADGAGKPWDASRPVLSWNGEKWVGDVPDFKPDSAPANTPAGTHDAGMGAFIMLPEGVARLFVPGQFAEGPFSEHYEPVEAPIPNPLHPSQSSNPAVKPFTTEFDKLGEAAEYPIVCTTYRLTEHFHYWTKNNPYNMQLQPEFFVEIPEELAKEKGIANGGKVKVTSARGSIEGKAMVTRRIKPMTVGGKKVYQIGFPIHWGFLGKGKQQGSLANLVTPTIVDPNSFAPEYKGFLVKLEKA